jgi:hypothetical protein
MKELFEDPPRWREHREQSDRAERTLGQDLRAIKTPAPLSGPQMARIAAGLRPSRPPRSLPWLVMAASLFLLVATAASAARLNLLPRWLKGASTPRPMPTPEARVGHRKPSVPGIGHAPKPTAVPNPREDISASPTSEMQAPAPPASETKTDTPASTKPIHREVPAPARLRPQAMARERSLGASDPTPHSSLPVQPQVTASNQLFSPPPPPVLSPPASAPLPSTYVSPTRTPRIAMLDPPRPLPAKPAQESAQPADETEASRLLANAIRLMRAEGQPQVALALLDRQATRLNESPYRHEAVLIRVEVLLALKRDADLLRLLDGMPLADVAASRTLLVTRGRLRAAAKRCAEALADFDRALAEPGRKDKQALLGRALCREALGDAEGARADRERYRQETSLTPRTPEPSRP